MQCGLLRLALHLSPYDPFRAPACRTGFAVQKNFQIFFFPLLYKN